MAESEPSASVVKKVDVGDLRGIIVDSDELAKGTRLVDDKALSNLARHKNKLFCDVKGSSGAPWKVTLAFSETSSGVRAICRCPAAMIQRRPFCKHAAALLVAWSRAPEAFVESEGPPAGAPGEAKKKAVKRGDATVADLRRRGVEQVGTLVRELAASGVASMGEERSEQIARLGAGLRDNKLIRLSARTLDLANMLAAGAAKRGSLPAIAYTDLVADLLLTARKLEKHLGGEAIDDRHVEELIGKTWRKTDLKTVSGLDLVEYAFFAWTTSDDYVIRESRYFDVASGAHYGEKQILPAGFIPDRPDPKPSRAGALLASASASAYPGYPPLRLAFTDLGDSKAIDHAVLARLTEQALPDVGSALTALQEHRRDVFAPDLLPVAIRVDTLFARGDRMQAVDAKGHALHLPVDPALEGRLGGALRDGKLVTLIGDVGIDAALPTVWPHAAVIEGPLGLELRSLVDPARSVKQGKIGPEEGSAAWIASAREAGASAAAIALAEVREELAHAFVLGLASLGARTADPLVARLRDLGLEKQGALLAAIAQRGEIAERLDDFVKLYQILGIALVRLAGATHVDRDTMERVPTYESVFVQRPEATLTPRDVDRRRAEGTINRYESAVHYARYYEALPPEELAANVFPIWADGSAAPYVVRAFAGRREQGLTAARKALASKRGRVAKITAIRVLQAIGGDDAAKILRALAAEERDVGLRALAADARDALDLAGPSGVAVRRRRGDVLARVNEIAQSGLTEPRKDDRIAAVHALTAQGHLGAIPPLRLALLSDASREVRKEAAMALALLGDTEMVETFLKMLRGRGEDDKEAKIGADALGLLGDARGLRELIAAYAEGYKPAVVAEALRAMGPVALDPVIDLIEEHPEIAARKAALSVLEQLPDRELAATLIARLEERAARDSFADVAMLYLKLAAVHPDARRAVGKAVLALAGDREDLKTLVKAAKKAL